MGLFDKFSSNVELTPAIALASSMVYMMASDGELADQEMNYLFVTLQSFGDPQELVDSASKYAKKNDLKTFQKEANEILSDDQKMTLLANLIDLLLADGSAEEEEQELFFTFADAFGVSEEDISPYIDIISVKNDFAVFL
ncbi:MAG TPA: TerB family tellurite resistance protein [Campylobacterales bacterium]|nr:TerB family tellurite resistance protein [Campylobacterales bacterium]HIP41461.1 TerB family tellurite resistance protein [Campylobacterales bacterium]